MKNLKFGLLGCGVIGLIATFLPLISFGELSISLWKMRIAPVGLDGHPYPHMLFMLVPIAMGAMWIKQGYQKWMGIASTVAFVLSFINFREGFFKLLTDGAIGAKLLFVAIVGGLVVSIISIVKANDM